VRDIGSISPVKQVGRKYAGLVVIPVTDVGREGPEDEAGGSL
jgi:hypothetical protein